ncbi:hypothetical protein ACSSS7_008069 [Eimeria intestinalis]
MLTRLPPRSRRALFEAAAEGADRSRSLSPIRSAASSAALIHPTPFEGSLSPLPCPQPDSTPSPKSDLLQWRRGILERLPRLDTVPRNYTDLRSFLQAIQLALQALDRLVDAFRVTNHAAAASAPTDAHPYLRDGPARHHTHAR